MRLCFGGYEDDLSIGMRGHDFFKLVNFVIVPTRIGADRHYEIGFKISGVSYAFKDGEGWWVGSAATISVSYAFVAHNIWICVTFRAAKGNPRELFLDDW